MPDAVRARVGVDREEVEPAVAVVVDPADASAHHRLVVVRHPEAERALPEVEADGRGEPYVRPAIAIRTGDTPPAERVKFQREPADILITTPESLYLLLTSNARNALREVHTIIVDEIHALVPTKRGAHLAASIERLAARCERPPQRIGLSATQRPLDEVARFLGGAEAPAAPRTGLAGSAGGATLRLDGQDRGQRDRSAGRHGDDKQAAVQNSIGDEFSTRRSVRYRPVSIVDAGARKALSVTIEVPVEDMGRGIPSGPTSAGDTRPSIWSAIHPRLLELIRAHRSTLIFVNSRRLAERLAGALNDLAGETIVRSHHGSIARDQRMEIEGVTPRQNGTPPLGVTAPQGRARPSSPSSCPVEMTLAPRRRTSPWTRRSLVATSTGR